MPGTLLPAFISLLTVKKREKRSPQLKKPSLPPEMLQALPAFGVSLAQLWSLGREVPTANLPSFHTSKWPPIYLSYPQLLPGLGRPSRWVTHRCPRRGTCWRAGSSSRRRMRRPHLLPPLCLAAALCPFLFWPRP